MITPISNSSGERNDKIANAARVIGKSKDRLEVFQNIYKGKKKIKTVTDIFSTSGLKTKKRVLEEAKILVSNDIVVQTKFEGETAYEKIDFYTATRDKIISLVKHPEKLSKIATRTNPQFTASTVIVKYPRNEIDIKFITIDDVDTFSKTRDVQVSQVNPSNVYERDIKSGLQKIIGERGTFKDWGGEHGDLFSTRFYINNKRLSVQFGLKGRGTQGKLVPGKMGKNGDQIQRLFASPADAYFVQYHSQIDESVISQMELIATGKSYLEMKRIYYGVIDGNDTAKLISAYPEAFQL